MWWYYHCYRPVGSMAVLNDYEDKIPSLHAGQTVLVIAADHEDNLAYYGVLDPLNPVEDHEGNCPSGSSNRLTVLEGYERFAFLWVWPENLLFLEAPA